jgi:hypothetical protein
MQVMPLKQLWIWQKWAASPVCWGSILLACFMASLALAQSASVPEAEPKRVLEPLPEAQWPLVFPPLQITITPRRTVPESEAAQAPADWALVPLANGKKGDLLGFLGLSLDHETGWTAKSAFAEHLTITGDKAYQPDIRQSLVERADLAVMMGGGFLGMSLAQIYVNFGFEPDGTRPLPKAYGIYSPVQPEMCLEGGISCRASIVKQ